MFSQTDSGILWIPSSNQTCWFCFRTGVRLVFDPYSSLFPQVALFSTLIKTSNWRYIRGFFIQVIRPWLRIETYVFSCFFGDPPRTLHLPLPIFSWFTSRRSPKKINILKLQHDVPQAGAGHVGPQLAQIQLDQLDVSKIGKDIMVYLMALKSCGKSYVVPIDSRVHKFQTNPVVRSLKPPCSQKMVLECG